VPVTPKITTRRVDAGEILLRPGEKIRNLYMIQSGLLASAS